MYSPDICGHSFSIDGFTRYINGRVIEEEFLFSKPLEMTAKAEDVMVSTLFEKMNLNWKKLAGVCG